MGLVGRGISVCVSFCSLSLEVDFGLLKRMKIGMRGM